MRKITILLLLPVILSGCGKLTKEEEIIQKLQDKIDTIIEMRLDKNETRKRIQNTRLQSCFEAHAFGIAKDIDCR